MISWWSYQGHGSRSHRCVAMIIAVSIFIDLFRGESKNRDQNQRSDSAIRDFLRFEKSIEIDSGIENSRSAISIFDFGRSSFRKKTGKIENSRCDFESRKIDENKNLRKSM
jgi:hypothetical protein